MTQEETNIVTECLTALATGMCESNPHDKVAYMQTVMNGVMKLLDTPDTTPLDDKLIDMCLQYGCSSASVKFKDGTCKSITVMV